MTSALVLTGFVAFIAAVLVCGIVSVLMWRTVVGTFLAQYSELREAYNEQEATLAAVIQEMSGMQMQSQKMLSVVMMMKKSMMTSLMRDTELFDSMVEDIGDIVPREIDDEEADRGEDSGLSGEGGDSVQRDDPE